MQSYYVDSCIYLNLWQKEVAFDGFKFWKVAKHFLEMVEDKKETIYYSGFLIREIKFILAKEEFKLRRKTFDSSPNFIKLNLSEEEFEEARRIEKLSNYKIGGPAKYFLEISNIDELIEGLKKWEEYRISPTLEVGLFVLGGGTNVLISDKGFDWFVFF